MAALPKFDRSFVMQCQGTPALIYLLFPILHRSYTTPLALSLISQFPVGVVFSEEKNLNPKT